MNFGSKQYISGHGELGEKALFFRTKEREIFHSIHGTTRELIKHPKYAEDENPTYTLLPGHTGLFDVAVQAPDSIAEEAVQVMIRGPELKTSAETIKIQVNFEFITGELGFQTGEAGFLLMGQAFPGRAISLPIKIMSSYNQMVFINDIAVSVSEPEHEAFSVVRMPNPTPVAPNTQGTEVGELLFDPGLICEDAWECIIFTASSHQSSKQGLSTSKINEKHLEILSHMKDWTKMLPKREEYAGNEVKEGSSALISSFETQAVQKLVHSLRQLEAHNLTTIAAKVQVSATIGAKKTLPVRAEVVVPSFQQGAIRLTSTQSHHFGLTLVGEKRPRYIAVFNPSDHPVRFRIALKIDDVFIKVVRSAEGIGTKALRPEILLQKNSVNNNCSTESKVEFPDEAGKSPVFYLSEDSLNPILVPPKFKAYLGPFFFAPSSMGNFTTTFYLANNMTILEEVKLSGPAGHGILSLVGSWWCEICTSSCKAPGNSSFLSSRENENVQQTLRFEVHPDDFSIKPSLPWPSPIFQGLLLQNVGNIPVQIKQLSFVGRKCSHMGFTIAPCVIDNVESVNFLPEKQLMVELRYRTACAFVKQQETLVIVTEQATHSVLLEAVMMEHDLHSCRVARFSNELKFLVTAKKLLICVGILAIILNVYVFLLKVEFQRRMENCGDVIKRDPKVALQMSTERKLSSSSLERDSQSLATEMPLSKAAFAKHLQRASSSPLALLQALECFVPSTILGIKYQDAGVSPLEDEFVSLRVEQLLTRRSAKQAAATSSEAKKFGTKTSKVENKRLVPGVQRDADRLSSKFEKKANSQNKSPAAKPPADVSNIPSLQVGNISVQSQKSPSTAPKGVNVFVNSLKSQETVSDSGSEEEIEKKVGRSLRKSARESSSDSISSDDSVLFGPAIPISANTMVQNSSFFSNATSPNALSGVLGKNETFHAPSTLNPLKYGNRSGSFERMNETNETPEIPVYAQAACFDLFTASMMSILNDTSPLSDEPTNNPKNVFVDDSAANELAASSDLFEVGSLASLFQNFNESSQEGVPTPVARTAASSRLATYISPSAALADDDSVPILNVDADPFVPTHNEAF